MNLEFQLRKKISAEQARKKLLRYLEGDAAEILHSLEGSYDLIFMDAAKGQYIHFFPECNETVSIGGIIDFR